MEQLRPVSKLEKILFPIIVTIVVCLLLPSTAPLVGMLMLGNLFRESGVVTSADRDCIQCTDVHRCYSAWYFRRSYHERRGIPEHEYDSRSLLLVLIAFAFGTAGRCSAW